MSYRIQPMTTPLNEDRTCCYIFSIFIYHCAVRNCADFSSMTTSRGLFDIEGVLYSMYLVIINVFSLPNLLPRMPRLLPSILKFKYATT